MSGEERKYNEMSSALEAIWLRMSSTLQASGLLASLEFERCDKSIILVLTPKGPISDRVMRFCLNFLGERKRTQIQQAELFLWCDAFIMETQEHCCRIWIDCESPGGDAGIDALSELIILGLTLSQSLVPSSYTYDQNDLLRTYRTKEDLLSFYADVVSQAMKDDADLPSLECDGTLFDGWLCCPRHRLLFLQRLHVVLWLYHLFELEQWNGFEREAPSYLLNPPSLEALLAHLLKQAFTPQEFLRSRVAYMVRREQEHWELPTPQCLRKHHLSMLCCPFHLSMMAISSLFSAWAVSFDDEYHISEMRDGQGHVGITSPVGIALFIQQTELDTSSMVFPESLQKALTRDVSKYRREGAQWGC